MADVCRTRGGALSPLSPNENRKRSRGSSGAQSTWFKRHRTGQSFARRLLHLRGFTLDVRQAEELVRYIDQFPPEMDKVRPRPDLVPFLGPSPRVLFPLHLRKPKTRPGKQAARASNRMRPSPEGTFFRNPVSWLVSFF
jgi:hypothetical protein